ncbi:MAG: hypothetical protein D6690_02225 [Nitrospirae bacterium]|nr:MAG: hypothetical protein D6690_02225 [Nitrospirota bacterium]
MNESDHDRERTWYAIGAATLSIVPGVGHLYVGVKRGYVFLACGLALIVVSQFFWPPGWLFYVQFAIFAAFDAFAFAKRGFGLF